MPHTIHDFFEKIKNAIHESEEIKSEEKDLMFERIEEWRHEDEAMRIIPEKLAEISEVIRPMLKEIGLL